MNFLSLLDPNTLQTVSGTAADASIPADTAPQTNTGGLQSFFGGLLSKAAETAIDVGGQLVKANNMPGTVYPTGQTNPAQITATAAANQAAAASSMNKQYLYIGAGVAVLLVVVLIVSKK